MGRIYNLLCGYKNRGIISLYSIAEDMNNKRIINSRFHHWNRWAQNALGKKICAVLSPEQLNELESFWNNYSKTNGLFHALYLDKTSNYSKYYIPDDIYYLYIDPYFNDWDKAKVFDNKCFYHVMLPELTLPYEVCYRVNGMWFDHSFSQINKSELCDILLKEEKLFFKKATESEGGEGVYYYPSFNYKDDIYNAINQMGEGDIVVQRSIVQNEQMAKLNPSSVNTVRVISLFNDGEVKVYSSIVRMGCGNSKVDNASSGGITCGIKQNGRLKTCAYSSSGIKYVEHPTTHVAFSDIVVPKYSEICEIVKKCATKFPYHRLLSWDFAIDNEGCPVFIEVNLRYGELDFHQFNNGPLFGEDTENILGQVFNKKRNQKDEV